MVQLSYPYMTTGKIIALTMWIFVGKVMSLPFNMLSRFFITILPRSNHLLILWLQSPSALILEVKKVTSDTVSTFSLCICHEVIGPDVNILIFLMLSFKWTFSLSSKGSLVSLRFLPLELYYPHMWGCWYFFSMQEAILWRWTFSSLFL